MENLEQALRDLPSLPEQSASQHAPQSIPDTPPAPVSPEMPLDTAGEQSNLMPGPRTLPEIRKAYGQLIGAAGQKAYESALLENELKGTPLSGIFGEMRALNDEAHQRNEIDRKLEAEKIAKAKTKRERKAEVVLERAHETITPIAEITPGELAPPAEAVPEA